MNRIKRFFRWLFRYTACLDQFDEAFCKRREGHHGKHRTGDKSLYWKVEYVDGRKWKIGSNGLWIEERQ